MSNESADFITHDKLASLMEMASLVNSSHERSVVMDHAVKSICRLTEAEAGSLLERLGLTERANDALESLSLGNQQRAQIAAALVHRPIALVLDEPFSGLDERLRDGIYVLRMDDMLSVKRVAIEPQGKRVSVLSDNPAYPSWRGLEKRTINIVGRVLWFGRTLR